MSYVANKSDCATSGSAGGDSNRMSRPTNLPNQITQLAE
jgi:hypothetical protein